MDNICARLLSLQHDIAHAAEKVGRDPSRVRLIAVSKFQPQEFVREALAAGQTCFGENRVKEAEEKFAPLRAAHPDLELHLIGPLQTNKTEDAVALFDVIQTVDRLKLAAALAKAIQKVGRTPRLYVEVNTGREPQKAGVFPEDLDAFLTQCHDDHGLTISGLMNIPPQGEDPAPHFHVLRSLADQHHLPHVSMGMSGDFQTAIACGATEVRLGTAIFGTRG